MNFEIFLCVTLKLFSLGLVPPLTPNPGNATAVKPANGHYLPGGGLWKSPVFVEGVIGLGVITEAIDSEINSL